MKKIKAFTILELVLYFSLTLILSTFIFLQSKRYLEEQKIREATLKILSTYTKYRDLSYYENKSFSLKISYLEKRIEIREGTTLKEVVFFPEELDYYIPHQDCFSGSLETKFTTNGNLSHAFTVYIFKKEKIASSKITFYTFSQLKFLIINVYKNMNLDKPFLNEILTYHNSYESQNNINWKKE